MRSFEYQTVDVFTDQRFGGNPLAVFPDARGLGDGEMQAIAREFNYSESTFVLPPEDPANTARVRIFTPVNELPFAGHPNVGTGFVLAAMGRATAGTMRFEEGAGLVELRLLADGGVSFRAPKPLELGPEVAAEAVAACLSLEVSEVVTAHHRPRSASVGLPFIFAEVRSLDALASVQPDTAAFARASAQYPGVAERFSLFAYVRTGAGSLRARMLAPLLGVAEDPATGSACAAVGGLLASLDERPEAELHLSIDQGVEMGRPSRIEVTAIRRAGAVAEVHIAGRCAPVMRGVLEL